MGENPVDIEVLKQQTEDENFNAAKFSKKFQRKIRKQAGNSFSDLLKKKFKQKKLERVNS